MQAIFSEKLNTLLVETFRDILRLEEKMLQSYGRMKISISEVHLIESVCKKSGEGRTISGLAEDLKITLPSVTNAVKRLEANGYVTKRKSEQDGRSVRVFVTRLGQKVDAAHRYFHRQMVNELTESLSERDREVLLHAVEKLDTFFKTKSEQDKYGF